MLLDVQRGHIPTLKWTSVGALLCLQIRFVQTNKKSGRHHFYERWTSAAESSYQFEDFVDHLTRSDDPSLRKRTWGIFLVILSDVPMFGFAPAFWILRVHRNTLQVEYSRCTSHPNTVLPLPGYSAVANSLGQVDNHQGETGF